MERREFLTKATGFLTILPITGGLTPIVKADITDKDKTTTLLNSEELNKLVRQYFYHPRKANGQIFLNRTPQLNKNDEEILSSIKTGVFITDIIHNEKIPIFEKVNGGKFEFLSANIPVLKTGITLSKEILLREAKALKGKASEDDLNFAYLWKNDFAETLALGLRQRVNIFICGAMLGGLDVHNGIKAYFDVPNDCHVSNNWNLIKPEKSIKAQVKHMKINYKQIMDRITLGSYHFIQIAESITGKSIRNKSIEEMELIIQKVSDDLELQIEITDERFLERNMNGHPVQRTVLPENKLILSNTANDNNPNVLYFGRGAVMETIDTIMVKNARLKHISIYEPFSYFHHNSYDSSEVRGWTIMRGFPVLKDRTAFSSITVE